LLFIDEHFFRGHVMSTEVCDNATFLITTRGDLEHSAPLEKLNFAKCGEDWNFCLVLIHHETCLPLGIIECVAQHFDLASAADIELVRFQLAYIAECEGFVPQGVMCGQIVMTAENRALWQKHVSLDDGFYFARRYTGNGEVFFYHLYQTGQIVFYF